MTLRAETHHKITYALQAALAEVPDDWETLEGFIYRTRTELDEIYEKRFQAMEGKGVNYRKVKFTVIHKMEVI